MRCSRQKNVCAIVCTSITVFEKRYGATFFASAIGFWACKSKCALLGSASAWVAVLRGIIGIEDYRSRTMQWPNFHGFLYINDRERVSNFTFKSIMKSVLLEKNQYILLTRLNCVLINIKDFLRTSWLLILIKINLKLFRNYKCRKGIFRG